MKQEGRVMVQPVSCQLLRPCSNPRLVHVGFVADRVAQGQDFFRVLRFQTVVHTHLLNYHRRYRISEINSTGNATNNGGSKKVMLPIFFSQILEFQLQ